MVARAPSLPIKIVCGTVAGAVGPPLPSYCLDTGAVRYSLVRTKAESRQSPVRVPPESRHSPVTVPSQSRHSP
eukprot:11225024-Lingulodinium_polyedra.AAC.1